MPALLGRRPPALHLLLVELEDVHRSPTAAAHEHRHQLTFVGLEKIGEKIVVETTKPLGFVKKPKSFLVSVVIIHCQPPVDTQHVEQATVADQVRHRRRVERWLVDSKLWELPWVPPATVGVLDSTGDLRNGERIVDAIHSSTLTIIDDKVKVGSMEREEVTDDASHKIDVGHRNFLIRTLAHREVPATGAADLGVGSLQVEAGLLEDFVVVRAVVPKVGGADVGGGVEEDRG